ncbi:hypothetical protein ACLMJK_004001 [Lecanora helva]
MSDMTQPLTEEQVNDYKHVFSLFDQNGDGQISAEELGGIMRSLGQKPTQSELEDIVTELDTDNNGTIDFEEFLAMMTRVTKEEDTDEELRRAFQVFDKDGSGTISTDELRDVLKSVGENLTETELDEMMRQVDVDGSGTIDFEEFVGLMRGTV